MSDTTDTSMAPEKQDEVIGFDAPKTMGERLIPVLVIALESCLLYALLLALAGFSFLGSASPLLPIWLIFGVSLSIYWLTTYLKRTEVTGKTGLLSLLHAFIPQLTGILLATSLTWLLLSLQAGTLFTLPSQETLLNAVRDLQSGVYQALILFTLISFMAWRGVDIARAGIKPQTIKRLTRLGLGCFFLVLLCYLVQGLLGLSNQNTPAFFLLIPAFLLLVLLGQALYQVSYLRRFHAVGLHGSARRQERLILQATGVLAIVVSAIVLVIGNVTSVFSAGAAAFFAPLGVLFDWLANALSQLLLLIWQVLLPLLVLIGGFLSWLINLLPYSSHKSPPSPSCDQLIALAHRLKQKINLPPACLKAKPTPLPVPNFLLANILRIMLLVDRKSVV